MIKFCITLFQRKFYRFGFAFDKLYFVFLPDELRFTLAMQGTRQKQNSQILPIIWYSFSFKMFSSSETVDELMYDW